MELYLAVYMYKNFKDTTNNLNEVEKSLKLIRSESEQKSIKFKISEDKQSAEIDSLKKDLHETKEELQLSKVCCV